MFDSKIRLQIIKHVYICDMYSSSDQQQNATDKSSILQRRDGIKLKIQTSDGETRHCLDYGWTTFGHDTEQAQYMVNIFTKLNPFSEV